MNSQNPRRITTQQLDAIRSIAFELADVAVTITEKALRDIRKKQSFKENPDVACTVLFGRVGNDLNDYFFDHYRHSFEAPPDMEDAQELTSVVSASVSGVVRKQCKLVLQDIYEDGIFDETFEELLFANIRSTVLEIVADNFEVEELTPNVSFE